MKRVRTTLLIMLSLAASGMTPILALAEPEINVDVAPPPAKAEGVPAPRSGYIWAPGYWDWSGHSYSWVSGNFVIERRNARWVADRWEAVGSQWHHVRGHWER